MALLLKAFKVILGLVAKLQTLPRGWFRLGFRSTRFQSVFSV